MSTSIAQRKQSLQEKIAVTSGIIAALEKDLRALDEEFASQSGKRKQYDLLANICSSLEKLDEMGASDLFWGNAAASKDHEQQLQHLRGKMAGFEQEISKLEQSRTILKQKIKKESTAEFLLKDELDELQEVLKNAENDYPIVRQPSDIPFRPMVMPWTRKGEDESRFRKILLLAFIVSIALAWLLPMLRQPVDRYKEVAIPEHIAQILKRRQEEKKIEPKPQEKAADKKDSSLPEKEAKPMTAEAKQARAVAQTKGVLAFKNNFADLMEDTAPVKMGAQARISSNENAAAANGSGGNTSGDATTRSMITSQATGGSGGINTSGLSRQGTGSGQSITGAGVKFARVESSIAAGVADEKPLGKGSGPSRTDEEIQIVFDRYKSALYRIYNRELRTDPTLRGKMVLRITIQPDGSVTACSVKTSDLASPALSKDIVERVLKFNFGVKEGVSALTILYPIEFMPAS